MGPRRQKLFMMGVVSCLLWLIFTSVVAMLFFALLKQRAPLPALTVLAAGALISAWLGAQCYWKGWQDGHSAKQ
jgi:hypothetical protein